MATPLNDISKEQAAQITDLESYKVVTGAKRFKRTKEEMLLGLTPEQGLERRLTMARGEQVPEALKRGIAQAKAGQLNDGPTSLRASTSRSGDIVIRPAAGTDSDYFQRVPQEPVEIVLDQQWYAWFDSLAESPFQGDVGKLLRFILDQGIGEVLTKFQYITDVEAFEKHTT